MHTTASRLLSCIFLGAALSLAPANLFAQDNPASKYLMIEREMLKPGQGAAHERSEAATARPIFRPKVRASTSA